MTKVEVISQYTKNLNKLKIDKICKLKKQNYSSWNLKSQKIWFKKNIKKNNIHNMIFIKNKLIGYNCLRGFYYKKKLIFYLFDTIIVDKKFRNLGISRFIMSKSNEIIKKKKIFGILVCKKGIQNYYNKFGWEKTKYLKNFKTQNKKIFLSYLLKSKLNFKCIFANSKLNIIN